MSWELFYRASNAAIDVVNNDMKAKEFPEIEVRQVKYLNNIIEQDHRAMKRVVSPMLGFKSFRSAEKTIAGIELMHMTRKNQMANPYGQSSAELLYGLASWSPQEEFDTRPKNSSWPPQQWPKK